MGERQKAETPPKCDTAPSTERMEAALRRIARWHGEFPRSERFCDDGTEMSYAGAFGSDGERDYMRQVALDALGDGQPPPAPLSKCPFCSSPLRSDGSIIHSAGCEGLEEAGINKLQLHELQRAFLGAVDRIIAPASHPAPPSALPEYRQALVNIRQLTRSVPSHANPAVRTVGAVYDIANRTLDAGGDLFAAHSDETARGRHGA